MDLVGQRSNCCDSCGSMVRFIQNGNILWRFRRKILNMGSFIRLFTMDWHLRQHVSRDLKIHRFVRERSGSWWLLRTWQYDLHRIRIPDSKTFFFNPTFEPTKPCNGHFCWSFLSTVEKLPAFIQFVGGLFAKGVHWDRHMAVSLPMAWVLNSVFVFVE